MLIPDLTSQGGQDAGKQLEHSGLPASRGSNQGRNTAILQFYIDWPDLRCRPIPVIRLSQQTMPASSIFRVVVANGPGPQDRTATIRAHTLGSYLRFSCIPSIMSCFHTSLLLTPSLLTRNFQNIRSQPPNVRLRLISWRSHLFPVHHRLLCSSLTDQTNIGNHVGDQGHQPHRQDHRQKQTQLPSGTVKGDTSIEFD